MRKATSYLLLCLLLLSFSSGQLNAQFAEIETDNIKLIYADGIHSFIAPYAAQCLENSIRYHCDLWDYRLSEKITLSLYDFSDYGNAGATSIPENRISVLIAPTSHAYDASPTNERINTILNHEMVHVVALDKPAGSERFFRSIFWGKVQETSANPLSIVYDYMTSPRRSAPRWFHEGIAVFLETWMAGGLGRAQSPYDEMVFRTMVRDSTRFYSPVGLESEGTAIDFHSGINSYLYGTRFFSYLAYTYGPESLMEWTSREKGTCRYYASQFKKVYGKSLSKAWREWVDWEHEFQTSNLDSIRQYSVTPHRQLTDRALGGVSRAFYDSESNKLYAAVNYPGQVAHIAEIDMSDGSIRKVRYIKGPAMFFVTSLAYDDSSRTLFYTTDNYDFRDLASVNVVTGKHKVLQKDFRVGDIVFNRADRSVWGVRHFNGLSTLVRIPYPYAKWDQILTLPYGKDLYDIDISVDGKLLSASLGNMSGIHSLVLFNLDTLMAGSETCDTLFEFGNSSPSNFVFSPDGKRLYGSSYYTGVSNIFRYDIDLDSLDAISNAETGFFKPLPVWDDSLIVFCYTGKGFLPSVIDEETLEDVSATRYLGTMIAREHSVVRDWISESPSSIEIDSLITGSGEYHPIANLRISSLYPVVEGYKEFASYGFRLNLKEPIGYHESDMTVSYSPYSSLPYDERWHADFRYRYLEWTLSAKYNSADFYDLFGPTKTSRKGYSAGLRFNRNLVYDLPRTMDLSVGVTGYGGLERLPDYQNVATSYDKFFTSDVSLFYTNRAFSLGAVDYEKGYLWRLTTDGTYVNEEFYPRMSADLDVGVPLPIHHSSVWLRLSGGYSPSDESQPFANFFFGGFGNNWVDHQTEKRYREYYSFPGTEINYVGGTSFGRALFEWNLPPLRFRQAGGSALYCSWMRMSLFSVALSTNVHNKDIRRDLVDAGAQIDLRFQMLSHLRLTFSFGYAMAFEEGRKPSEELMFSLKVL